MEIKWLPHKEQTQALSNWAWYETEWDEGYNKAIDACEKAILENLPSEEEIFTFIFDGISSEKYHFIAKKIYQRLVNGKGV